MSHSSTVNPPSPNITQDSKVVKHNYKIFTSTARKEQKEQNRLTSQGQTSIMSTPSNGNGRVTPSSSPKLSPIPSEAHDVTAVDGSSAEVAQVTGKPRTNAVGQNRSASFSHVPSYNSYHKNGSRAYQGTYVRNSTGVGNSTCDSNQARESPDSSSRTNAGTRDRVVSLTGNTVVRSGINNRGRGRGGYSNRPSGRPFQSIGPTMYPRYPGPQYMVPMPYPYYSGGYPMPVPPQPGTAVIIPDPNCRCVDCLTFFANAMISGFYNAPVSVMAPQLVPSQPQSGQVPSDNGVRTLIPGGPYMQAPLLPFFHDYSAFAAQQALSYQQQPNVQTVNGHMKNVPEPKNELTPIDPPGSFVGNGYYQPMQQQYFTILAQGTPGEMAQTGQQSLNSQPVNPGNASANSFPYAIVGDRVIQNTSPPSAGNR